MEVVPTMSIDKVGRTPKRRRLDNDVQLPSYNRLKVPTFLSYEYVGIYDLPSKLERWLPAMARTLLANDWSLLQQFSAMDPKRSVKDALDAELAALCVWFLYIDVPRKMKVGIIRAFRNICFGPSKATNMSTDQESVEKLLVRALNTGNADVQRQVCLALAFLACCSVLNHLTINFGAAIQDKLLQLVRSSDPNLTFPVLSAVAGLGQASKEMRAKIVRTEISYSWLLKLMISRLDDKLIMERACWTVACIPCGGKLSEGLWGRLKDIIRVIVGMPFKDHFLVSRGAAHAIYMITQFASPSQIKELVDLDGLKVLFIFLEVDDDVTYTSCLDAIKNILKAGDEDVLRARSGKGDGEGKAGDEDVLRLRSGEGEGDGEGKAGDEDVLGEGDGDGEGEDESEGEDEDMGDGEDEDMGDGEDIGGEGDSDGDGDGDGDSDGDGKSDGEGESYSKRDSDIEDDIDEDVAQLNAYAKMIDGYWPGWRMLLDSGGFDTAPPSTACEAKRLLVKYRPREFTGLYLWC